jgi:hypothetical protein
MDTLIEDALNAAALRPTQTISMKCILDPLPCPVVAGECDRDGECYIWRCENPHAPKPELEENDIDQIVNVARAVA